MSAGIIEIKEPIDKEKIYTGDKTYRQAGPQEILVITPDKKYRLDPELSQKLWNHSPDGFQWGYAGSGPSQASLAILLDYAGNSELALRLHQEFKREVITMLSARFTLTGEEIWSWLLSKGEIL